MNCTRIELRYIYNIYKCPCIIFFCEIQQLKIHFSSESLYFQLISRVTYPSWAWHYRITLATVPPSAQHHRITLATVSPGPRITVATITLHAWYYQITLATVPPWAQHH